MPRSPHRTWLTTLSSAALCLGLTAAFAASPPPAPQKEDSKPIALFNGKDLDGWEGDPALWSVKDGAITGVTNTEKPLKYNKFLIYRREVPTDFELTASFRLVGNNNSGIQYRSKQLPNAGEFVVGGYQADIHPSPDYCGMLYDERGRGIVAEAGQKVHVTPDGKKIVVGKTDPAEPTKLEDWNILKIKAVGNHLVHTLNGRTIVDVTDFDEKNRDFDGIVALQVHAGPAMTVQYRSIELKPLARGEVIPYDESKSKPLPAAPKVAAPKTQAKAKAAAKKKQQDGPAPEATPISRLKVAKGFKVELVHTVARESEGSWVSMTPDPKGRLIVSDQYGKLFRVTPSKPGADAADTKVEPIDVAIGEAQGLLWAFDSLYVVVNRGQKYDSGLYRVTDTDKDDKLDKVELLRKLDGGGEHGPHAVVLAPDGKSLYVIAGNATKLPELAGSLVPRVWGEDALIPRMPDGAGFMTDEKAPGGWVCKVDPDGKAFELVSMGYRNPYDFAFNRDGEAFLYDSDMEWDYSLPWYRPTRVCQITSGSDFGYRNGSGKWPTYYFDSLPPVVEIGPGSPTGVAFGYGAKFPAKYQDALFISDWSYGKLYAVHMKPTGAGYTGELEEFIAGSPLPLTDVVVNPTDGGLYFAIGGRRTTSSLYRVVYTGDESTAASTGSNAGAEARATRKTLEAFHGHADPKALETAWPYLGDKDRFIAFAARTAVESQDPSAWRQKALTETNPPAALNALLALARVSAKDPAHREASDPAPNAADATAILNALEALAPRLSPGQERVNFLRVIEVVLTRFGQPETRVAEQVLNRLRPWFPSKSPQENAELAQIFVALEAPDAASKVVGLLAKAPTQEEQIDYAKDLRLLKTGWTPELRMAYFAWFLKAAAYKGGNSFPGFMSQIKKASLGNLSEAEKAELKAIIDAGTAGTQPKGATPTVASRPLVKTWTMDELVPLIEKNLHGRDFDKGRSLFAATACFSCHRFNNEGGGSGPELTGLAGRFNARDLMDSIVNPSKVISDQYAAVQIATSDGEVVTGRIVNLNGDSMSIGTNMLEPNTQVRVDRRKVEEMKLSPVSMMPEGLLNTLDREEVLDLTAYLMSRGDRNAEPYRKP